MKKYLLLIISLVLHLGGFGLIVYLVWPIAKWYLEKLPVRGVDIYLSASYVSHLLKHPAFRFNGWKDIWFSGVPYYKDYPSFYFYLMIPFAKHFGLIPGIQMFAVTGLFVFAAFSYLLYHQLSKNRILAIILTLTTLFSANLYRALIWAGGIPFWTTQAFFPIVIFLVAKYCQSQNSKWLYLASLATGLGIMGHPQSFFNVILAAAVAILLFWQPASAEASAGGPREKKTKIKKRIFDVLKFGGATYLIGLPEISQLFTLTSLVTGLINKILSPFKMSVPPSTGGTAVSPETLADIEAWTRAQFNLVWTDSNRLLWYLLGISFGIFILSAFFRRRKIKAFILLVPFLAIAVLAVGLVFLYSRGIDLYVTGWYKVFWPVLVGVATLTAFLWGEAKQVFRERQFWQKRQIKVVGWMGVAVVNLALVAVAYYFLPTSLTTTIEKFEKIDNQSSAFPDALNYYVSDQELKLLAEKIKPKLMVGDPHDFRLYIIDATVNIWWGALEDVPLTRGYVDPPLSTLERWGLFWLDAALGPSGEGDKSSLIIDWETPEEVVDNNIPFLLDWYGTKYLEGNHLSLSNSIFASNLIQERFIEEKETITIKGVLKNRFEEGGKPERWDPEGKQELNFYRVRSDLASPILIATDATPVMHIGGKDGYDTLTRYLGMMNLGPRNIVLARGPKYIDGLSFSDLTNFEALILYKYDYRNRDKAWKLIDRYLEMGGKVLIDTGAEVKESDTTKLPANFPSELPGIFPIKQTVREDLGKDWEPQAASVPATEGIDFSQFSPLVFDGGVWNVSHPPTEEDLREDARVVLRHKGIPVVVEREVGEGRVIWSGFNLPYHVIRDYNFEEGKFFKNLLSELVDLGESPVLSKGSWISPRERIISVNEAKGVVFKEQAFDGWEAEAISNIKSQKSKIYKVGPTSPGFMYVRLPEDFAGQVRFRYNGALEAKTYSAISALAILFILDYLLGGRVLIALGRRVVVPIKKRVEKWWEREEEY